MRIISLLALSGSLRAASLNTLLLRALARLAPPDTRVDVFARMGALPLFNPDIERDNPAPVADLRARLIAADGVLIASPEYAHGVTGVMKNALDWMVGNESFVDKPVALLNASPRAVHAQASLKEILTTMNAVVIEEASLAVPILGSKLDEDDIASHAEISSALRGALLAFRNFILSRPPID